MPAIGVPQRPDIARLQPTETNHPSHGAAASGLPATLSAPGSPILSEGTPAGGAKLTDSSIETGGPQIQAAPAQMRVQASAPHGLNSGVRGLSDPGIRKSARLYGATGVGAEMSATNNGATVAEVAATPTRGASTASPLSSPITPNAAGGGGSGGAGGASAAGGAGAASVPSGATTTPPPAATTKEIANQNKLLKSQIASLRTNSAAVAVRLGASLLQDAKSAYARASTDVKAAKQEVKSAATMKFHGVSNGLSVVTPLLDQPIETIKTASQALAAGESCLNALSKEPKLPHKPAQADACHVSAKSALTSRDKALGEIESSQTVIASVLAGLHDALETRSQDSSLSSQERQEALAEAKRVKLKQSSFEKKMLAAKEAMGPDGLRKGSAAKQYRTHLKTAVAHLKKLIELHRQNIDAVRGWMAAYSFSSPTQAQTLREKLGSAVQALKDAEGNLDQMAADLGDALSGSETWGGDEIDASRNTVAALASLDPTCPALLTSLGKKPSASARP